MLPPPTIMIIVHPPTEPTLAAPPLIKIFHEPLRHAPQPPGIARGLLPPDAVHIPPRPENDAPEQQAQDERDPEDDDAARVVEDLERDEQDEGEEEDGDEVRGRRGGEEGGERADDVGIDEGRAEVEKVRRQGGRGRGEGGEEGAVVGGEVVVAVVGDEGEDVFCCQYLLAS